MLEYTDGSNSATLPDGTYLYAIANVRQENGQEAFSDLSATVEAVSENSGNALDFQFEELSDGERVLIALYTLIHYY